MRCGVVSAAEELLAEIDPVAQDREHGDVGPESAAAGAVAVVVEPVGDGWSTEPLGAYRWKM